MIPIYITELNERGELILRLEEGCFSGRAEAELLRDDLTWINQVLSIDNPRIQDFETQKVKNERIVGKCKELLRKLEE